MRWSRRGTAILLATLAAAAVGIGAQVQHEEYLNARASPGVVGYGVILTGVLAAAAATGAVALLASHRPAGRNAWLAPAATFLGITVLLFLVQQAWINAVVPDRLLHARLSVSPLASNAPASPSLLAPIVALAAAAAMATWWGVTRWHPLALRPLHPAALRLALTPFLAVPAAGLLLIVAAGLPRGHEGAYAFLLVILAGLYAALSAASAWVALRPASLRARTVERRLAWSTLACLAAVALPFDSKVALLDDPLSFGAGLRPHTIMLAFLLVPLHPLLRKPRPEPAGEPVAKARKGRTGRGVAGKAAPETPVPPQAAPAAVYLAATALTWALALAAAFLGAGALVPWVAAGVPAAAGAWILRDGRSASAGLALVAFAAWGIGNTMAATYDVSSGSGLLRYWPAGPETPVVLLLWRLAAVTAFALAAWLLLRRPGLEGRTGAACACIAFVALLLLPLGITTDTTSGSDAGTAGLRIVAAGSTIAQQDASVRFVMHGAALALAGTAAYLASRWDAATRPRPPGTVDEPATA